MAPTNHSSAHTRKQDVTQVTLRREQSDGEALLFQIYASTREEELNLAGWDLPTRRAFVEMQFKAMRQGYGSTFPQAEFSIILRNGIPAGRLVVNRDDDEIRVVDIALLPAFRNQGIGSILLKGICAEAFRSHQPVRITVLKNHRSIRLYQRLGFVRVQDSGAYDLMEWRPETAGSAANP